MNGKYPNRIVTLSGELTEVIYLLGGKKRIAGVSAFSVHPPEARNEKPVISGFTYGNISKILKLKPDLVLAYSDLQAEMVRELARAGLEIHLFNQRTVAGIFKMIRTVGWLIGSPKKADHLVGKLESNLEAERMKGNIGIRRPVVFFEEWNQPIICGIQWVSELIEIAGGIDCFRTLSRKPLAADRVISSGSVVMKKRPDIILGSWCGRRFKPEEVIRRPGWEAIPAVKRRDIYEVSSNDILQPGPTALTRGVAVLGGIIRGWHARRNVI